MAICQQTENIIMKNIICYNIVWKFFCGDHILIKFFFGCIIDIQKKLKKKKEFQATESIFMLFLTNIVDVRILCVEKAEDVVPLRDIGGFSER